MDLVNRMFRAPLTAGDELMDMRNMGTCPFDNGMVYLICFM